MLVLRHSVPYCLSRSLEDDTRFTRIPSRLLLTVDHEASMMTFLDCEVFEIGCENNRLDFLFFYYERQFSWCPMVLV